MGEGTDERLRRALTMRGLPFRANDNISAVLGDGDRQDIEDLVTERMRGVLDALVIDVDDDHNTKGTARRVARMFVREVFKGRYEPAPDITRFPNAGHLDEIYALGPITIRATCSHHLVPFIGRCWVGIKPGEHVLGISKFVRLADWVFSRPQIQEEATIILANHIEKVADPEGLVVIVRAMHHCMTWRGVRETETEMTTSVVRGCFREDPAMKSEFMELIRR